MKTLAVQGDPWQTDQRDLLKFASGYPAPRTGSWKLQLRRDLKSPLVWVLVGFAVTSLVLAILWRQPLMVPNALLMLLIMGHMFRSVSAGMLSPPCSAAFLLIPAICGVIRCFWVTSPRRRLVSRDPRRT